MTADWPDGTCRLAVAAGRSARTPTTGRGTRPRPGCAPTRAPRPTSLAAHPNLPEPLPKDGLLPDLALYEHLIRDGLLAADARGAAVDHITDRRLAIWIAAGRPRNAADRKSVV